MKRTLAWLMAAALFAALPGQLLAQGAPMLLSYQGYMSDSLGNPVKGQWTISFALFKKAQGGEAFYQETRDVSCDLGLFSALLGSEAANPLDLEPFESGTVYLELTVETDAGPITLSPRQQVVSQPFALISQQAFNSHQATTCDSAKDAETLGGVASGQFVTVEQIPGMCITVATLPEQLALLGYVPGGGSGYGDPEVAKYLADNGFSPCACYGDADVAALLLAGGYVPGPHFSGNFSDLKGVPDFALTADVVQLVIQSGLVLLADGSVSLTGDLNAAGRQLLNFVVHNAASTQSPKSPKAGQLWWNTTDKNLQVYDGSKWTAVGTGVQGPSTDVSCVGCVDADDVSFPYAAASQKGGAATNALDVTCVGCVSEAEVAFPWAKGVAPGGDAVNAVQATNAATAAMATDVACAGCIDTADIAANAVKAKATGFDDTKTKLGATDVQIAIEKIVTGSSSGFQEGNGVVQPYKESWGIPAYGTITDYLHLLNPAVPKVIAYLYGGESSAAGSSNNLVVAYDFAPNQYSAGAAGNKGEIALQVSNPSIFNPGSHIMIHQTIGVPNGTAGGTWELNQVTSVQGTTLQLVKPLSNTYVSGQTSKAQAVLAASFNNIEVVSGGTVRPSEPLAEDGSKGGIVYIRSNQITVKTGGKIIANYAGYLGGTTGALGQQGSSECKAGAEGVPQPNCSGGGASDQICGAGGGGGNKEAGVDGATGSGCSAKGTGGLKKGDANLATLQFGGGGGATPFQKGGKGGGIVVLGAQKVFVQEGGVVSALGESVPPESYVGGAGAGAGAGGTVAVFADVYQNTGTVSAAGGAGATATTPMLSNPLALTAVSFDTRSHGGGYSPNYKEFWYPHWSGSTVYVYNQNYQQTGSFNSGRSEIMQLWGDADGTYYTANWGYYNVAKWSAKSSSQQWVYNMGDYAGGICSDGTHVYAMRNSGNSVWKLNKSNGSLVEQFTLPGANPNGLYSIVCTPGRLYITQGNGLVQIFDLGQKALLGTFSAASNIYNLSFDGQIMYVSANNSTVYRYRLSVTDPTTSVGNGGKGGDGWVVQKNPIAGVINESFPKGIQLWIDGANVTAQVGDPNGKGAPQWDAAQGVWGQDGLTEWSSGPLDLSTAANWTLGEHKIQLKETGGAGGDLKLFMYVIYPFSKAVAPANDTCGAPQVLDVMNGPVTVSGTTEDTMGKIKANDDSVQAFCGGSNGPDVMYQINLTEWRSLTVNVTAPFIPRTYIRSGDCANGQAVSCGTTQMVTAALKPGTYYLIVDSDGNLQKGNFTLSVTPAEPGPPPNNTCSGAEQLIFQNGVAEVYGMNLFSTNNYSASCGGTQGRENVYKFSLNAGTQQVSVHVDAQFDPVIYLSKDSCSGPFIACVPGTDYSMSWPTDGTYYLFVDGKTADSKGEYTLKVTVK